jgi:NAD(P)H dehydrogenase (quinone)
MASSSSASAPSVALIGATGFIGKPLLTTFTAALVSGTISRLVLLTRDAGKLQTATSDAVEVQEVDFSENSTLVAALRSVDVLISAMGMSGDVHAVKKNLVEAAAEAGVKVYGLPPSFLPSHSED